LATTTAYFIPATKVKEEGELITLEIKTFRGVVTVDVKRGSTDWEEGNGLWTRKVGRWVPDTDSGVTDEVAWDRIAIDCSLHLKERYHIIDRASVKEFRELPTSGKKDSPASQLKKIEKLCYHLALEMIGEYTDMKIGNRTAKKALFSSDESGYTVDIVWKGPREKKEKMVFSASGTLLQHHT